MPEGVSAVKPPTASATSRVTSACKEAMEPTLAYLSKPCGDYTSDLQPYFAFADQDGTVACMHIGSL